MALRVGIDMDGTLADLSSAYHEVERALFGERESHTVRPADDEEIEQGEQEEAIDGKSLVKTARREARERDLVWQTIRSTEDFWLGLRPLEAGVVRSLNDVSLKHGWETFFVTQRPRTAGRTVQRQTQLWLEREGFECPSVLTLSGGRGRAAAALELDVLLDDYPKNCVDVVSDSRCRPILIQRTPSVSTQAAARRLGITVLHSAADAIALLETDDILARPGLLRRVLGRIRKGV